MWRGGGMNFKCTYVMTDLNDQRFQQQQKPRIYSLSHYQYDRVHMLSEQRLPV